MRTTLALLLVGCGTKTPTSTHSGSPPPEPSTDGSGTPAPTTTPTDGSTGPTADTGGSSGAHSGTPGTTTLSAPTAVGQCDGYPPDSLVNPQPTTPELHVFGVYEGDAPPANQLTVAIQRPTELALVLSSYASVDWRVVVDPAATLSGIVISGYDPQTITVTDTSGNPLAVPISNRSPSSNHWFGEIGYSTDPGYHLQDTQALIADAEQATGLDATSFWGCYHATGFLLR